MGGKEDGRGGDEERKGINMARISKRPDAVYTCTEQIFHDLENHFNKEFKNLDEQLKNKIKEIASKICNLEKFIILDEDKFYPTLKSAYSEGIKKLEEQISIRKEYLQKVKKALKTAPNRECY